MAGDTAILGRAQGRQRRRLWILETDASERDRNHILNERDLASAIEAAEKASADALREALSPLVRCGRCGCLLDVRHPAVSVMRRGVDAPCAVCVWCKSEVTKHGYVPVKRESA